MHVMCSASTSRGKISGSVSPSRAMSDNLFPLCFRAEKLRREHKELTTFVVWVHGWMDLSLIIATRTAKFPHYLPDTKKTTGRLIPMLFCVKKNVGAPPSFDCLMDCSMDTGYVS